MRTPEPIFPSFTLVLSQANYTYRLPAYRVSHMLRYHPYPRYGNPRPRVDPFMVTIDERDGAGGSRELVDLDIPPLSLDDPQEEAAATALDQALNGPNDIEVNLGRRLSTLVVDLALYLVHRLRRVRQLSTQIQPDVMLEVTAK